MLRDFSRVATLAVLAFASGAGSPISPSVWAQPAAPAGPSGSAIDYQSNNRTLTVHLNGLPLRQVIEELSKQTRIRFRPPAPDQTFDNRPVTASFERMPIERAIKQLLGPSNTAMLYGPAPDSGRGTQPALAEVRVLDLGVIPVAATNNEPATSPVIHLTPEQLRAQRETMQKQRDERLQARGNNGRGGPRNASPP